MIKLAIDLGSSVTKIYRADTNNGIVLAEPSCVAVVGAENVVRAVGKEAKYLIGKTAEMTNIVYPIVEGCIYNLPLAVIMLKEFLSRVGVNAGIARSVQVLVSVPCGINEQDLSGYKELVEECGIRKVWFVEQPYLAVLGAGAVIEGDPIFCLDIGGGVTNAAVVSCDGIIAGVSMNVGGKNIDDDIIAKVSENKKLWIGALTAERIKNEIASVEDTVRGSIVAEGSSSETFQPAATPIYAEEVTESVRITLRKASDYASTVLWNLPAEVAAAVKRNGVCLSGGVLKIPGAARYLAERIGMRYRLCEEPQFTTVLGGGMLLQDKALMKRFAKKSED